MSKRNKNRAAAKQSVQQSSGVSAEAFSFGDPIGTGPPGTAGLCGVRADGPLV